MPNWFLNIINYVLLISNFAAQSVCDQTKKALEPLKDQFAKLQQHINADNYYKFIQLWKNDLQQIVFILALLTWLESRRLIDLHEIEQFLGREWFNLPI